ncbi:probable 28S ribosomal protein S25, mitochondrial [Oppia nitens]|uniref:probable 28S ribosomal protein S25, mitochondrial n=1 Tax=Oppia nitens TaxID=1686743 RepID=UPI0023D984BA|nr:probable 28S ribosomal protein S25, mitochondrial [Oppia nitens]
MPFFFGPSPIRRTIPYLTSGKLVFRNRVKIMEICYNQFWKYWRKDGSNKPHPTYDNHIGLRELYFWNIPQIQYMNPELQIVRHVEKFPNPFIRCWLDNGKDVVFDCDSKSRHEIMDQLIKTLGKTDEILAMEKSITQEDNPALFGYKLKRWCMCAEPGQCPCTGVVMMPKVMRGKYFLYLKDDLEKEEKQILSGEREPLYESDKMPLFKQARKHWKGWKKDRKPNNSDDLTGEATVDTHNDQ